MLSWEIFWSVLAALLIANLISHLLGSWGGVIGNMLSMGNSIIAELQNIQTLLRIK